MNRQTRFVKGRFEDFAEYGSKFVVVGVPRKDEQKVPPIAAPF